MSLLFADGSAAADSFDMHQGDHAYLDVYLRDKETRGAIDATAFPEIIWALSLAGSEIIKTKSASQITHPQSDVIRIALDAEDTQELHGLYRHQLRVINSSSNNEIVLDGKGQFVRQVFTSAA